MADAPSPFRRVGEVQQIDPRAWMRGCNYKRIESLDELDDYLLPALQDRRVVGADWETTTLNTWKAMPVGFNVSIDHGNARYVPVGHLVGYEKNLPLHEVVRRIVLLDAVGVPTVWYGFKYDHEINLKYGVNLTHWEDALFGSILGAPNHKQFGLKAVADRLLGIEMLSYKETAAGRNFAELDPDEVVDYGCGDADCTRRIYLHPLVQRKLQEQRAVYQLEKKFFYVVRRAIQTGTYLDDEKLAEMETFLGGEVSVKKGSKKIVTRPMSGQIKALTDDILQVFTDAGIEVDLGSPVQLGQALLKLGVEITEKTDAADQVATGKEILERYKTAHPVIEKIIKLREFVAYDRNYIRKMRLGVSFFGPHVRFPFNQYGAPTGRMSSGGEGHKKDVTGFEKGFVNMNIQSLPDPEKKPYLPDIRNAVVAEPPGGTPEEPAGTWSVVSIDYSQIQLRITANLSREPQWIDAFQTGEDIHFRNAKLAYADPTLPKYIEDPEKGTIENPKRKKGKAVALDEWLPTPDGWRQIRDIEEGDYIFDDTGALTRVELTSDVFRDRPCYRVTLTDHTSVTVDGEHLWTVVDATGRPRTISTAELGCQLLKGQKRPEYRWRVPAAGPLQYPIREPLPLDPYLLGVWLGDGWSYGARISTADPAIVDAWVADGWICKHVAGYDYDISASRRWVRETSLLSILGRLNLLKNKHIPLHYLRGSSIPARQALLQGLMDTDGCCNKDGGALFYSVNPQLADGVYELAVGLGCKVTRRVKASRIGEARYVDCHVLQIKAPFQLFRLERKAARYRPKWPVRSITSVTRVESVPTKCLGVDAPSHLFLVGRSCIPTHNTMGFAVLFGANEGTVAEHGGIPESQAKELLDNFWVGAPRLKQWIEQTHAHARSEHMVRTVLGRQRPLKEFYTHRERWMHGKGDREAVNHQVQGGEADIFKIACVRIEDMLTQYGWHDRCQIMLFMHDEIVFRVKTAVLDDVVPKLREQMEGVQFPGWPVPFTTDAKSGNNWGTGLTRSYGPLRPPASRPDSERATEPSTPRETRPDAPALPAAPSWRS